MAQPIDIEANAAFFDRLVELIPAKHYLAEPDDKVDLRHMKKAQREAAKAAFKQQHKEAKRAMLDPSTAKGTLELQRLKSAAQRQAAAQQPSSEDEASGDDEEDDMQSSSSESESSSGDEGEQDAIAIEPDEGAPAAPRNGALIDEPSNPKHDEQELPNPSKAELKARLQSRLADLRRQRKADEQVKKKEDAKNWRDSALERGRQAAAARKKAEKRSAPLEATPSNRTAQNGDGKRRRTGKDDGVGKLAFTKVEFGNDGGGGPRQHRKKPRPSKAELLEVAERKQQEQQGGEGGGDWKAALARAKGEKVLDDPKLLRKSLKKDAKLKKKKSAAWAERTEQQKETQAARQAKRKDNLQARANARKEKKKVRREKKLLRAGFEGRKNGFITPQSAKK
jgi:hypothetical protein